jgi:hypothetical protein
MKKPSYAGILKAFVLFTASLGVVFFVYALMDSTARNRQIFPHNPPVKVKNIDTAEIKAGMQKQMQTFIPAVFKSGMHPGAKIQVAVLLDVSNSMDGLIDQAKAQLWNMVNVMGEVRCEGLQPKFELALYEYGRTDNDRGKGYVKQLHPFTTDLDAVSSTLFSLKTNGGEEYCPDVIVQSADDLPWDHQTSAYKVIFIAGNESFRQGGVPWTKACEKAKEKSIIVNTIFCGSREEGLREHWNLGAECGSGQFTNINQDAVIEDIPTPYDSTMIVLNEQLNATYIAYGTRGEAAALMQADVDKKNFELSSAAGAKRVEAKAKSSVYNNEGWDLVDAMKADSTTVAKLSKDALPESMKNKSKKEIEAELAQKAMERSAVQRQIAETSIKRNEFMDNEKKTRAINGQTQTLETEIEKIIRSQVLRFNMRVQ